MLGVNPIPQKIAVLCGYALLPERVGGMDYFFWKFDAFCKQNNCIIDWYFPNDSAHQGYKNLNRFSSDGGNVERYFLNHAPVEHYDVIFTHFVELCTSTLKEIKQKSGAKLIVVDHNPRPIGGYPLKKRIQKRLKGMFFSSYIDCFVGVSEYSRTQMLKELGAQIQPRTQVIFNGLQTEKFQQRTVCSFRGKFIIASHLRKDKGIQDVVEAVRLLVQRQPNLQFSIDVFGEGYYEKELKQMVVDHQLTAYFQFQGSVSNLHERYAEYDYLIHPSHGETFCYSVVEALLCRLPVITTKNQGNVLGLVQESVNGFLFLERDAVQLASCLEEIISKSIALDNSVHYNTQIDQLTLDAMVQNYYQLLS
ncbi:MAG: hypothetical protein RL607_546 [Bacteroidota bacterium]|jgi:glycosyltransferase involved in cell wall biosynthesis